MSESLEADWETVRAALTSFGRIYSPDKNDRDKVEGKISDFIGRAGVRAAEADVLQGILIDKAREIARLKSDVAELTETLSIKRELPHPLDEMLSSIGLDGEIPFGGARLVVTATHEPNRFADWRIVNISREEPLAQFPDNSSA